MSQAIKYIYIEINIDYANEAIKFITIKFLGVQINNNLTW
jgi:hypothetical protein